MSILSFGGRIPNPGGVVKNPKNLLNKGALQALASGLIANQSRFQVAEDIPTVEKLRAIRWGKSFLWSFRFENPADESLYKVPAAFYDWFPALDIEDVLASVENYTIQGPLSSYKIPKSTRDMTFRMTFTDDQEGTLLNWFEKWMNRDMFSRFNVGDIEDGVLTLEEAARKITYRRYSNTTETLIRKTYLVIPEGDLVFQGNSSSDQLTYSIQFAIVGKFPDEISQDKGGQNPLGSAITKAKRTISSFGINPFG